MFDAQSLISFFPVGKVWSDNVETKKEMMPFAVIGAEGQYNVNGREVRGRQYPWGIIEVDNAKHCDFSYLRHALLT